MRYSIASALLLLAVTPAWLQAQVKYPVFDESKDSLQNVVFKEATERGDYQHGKLLRITLNGDANPTVKGTLVRTDASKRVIYVRTQPGAAPRAIPISDIKRIDKGTIKEAADSHDVTAPEIRQLVIYNGGKREVAYFGPTLSPAELANLSQLETAENELANLQHLARLEERAVENDVAIQSEQRRTLELTNQLIAQRLHFGSERPLYQGESRPSESIGAPAWSMESLPAVMFGQTSPLPFVRLGPAVFPKLPVGPEALAQARRNYATAHNHAVFENGRLIAVVVPESGDKTAAANR